MIKLDVAYYCDNCTEFEPDVEKPSRCYSNYEVIYQTDTIVRCEHRDRCEMIRLRLKKELEGEVQ